jgi:AraC-like DNA-binding protein
MPSGRSHSRLRGLQRLSSPADREGFRREFLARTGSIEAAVELFNHLPGVFFFVKNARSQLVCASEPTLRHLNVARPADFAGSTDYDHFPRHIADNFVRDDQIVMRTGRPLLHHVEIWYSEQHLLDWFVTNKFPLRDARGRVIGVYGTTQSYEGRKHSHVPFLNISGTVDYIRKNLHSRITVGDLVGVSGLSPRQLHRKFRQAFGLSVQDFLTNTRLQAATHALLHSDRTIADIALEYGYCDQSAFTHQFRKNTGSTPRQFRLRYTSGGAQ